MLYFAYGSNLWPPRLAARIPSARIVGRAWLPGWNLHFHKRSNLDASGKASVAPSRRPEAKERGVWGAIYRLSPDEIEALDRACGRTLTGRKSSSTIFDPRRGARLRPPVPR